MRPASEVWQQAVDALFRSARPVAGDPEIASVDHDVAAAIIEQDRAALVAEIVAWLRAKYTVTDEFSTIRRPVNPDGFEAADRITALIAAGDRLAGFAGHDHQCFERNPNGVHLPRCTCGFTDALKAWRKETGHE